MLTPTAPSTPIYRNTADWNPNVSRCPYDGGPLLYDVPSRPTSSSATRRLGHAELGARRAPRRQSHHQADAALRAVHRRRARDERHHLSGRRPLRRRDPGRARRLGALGHRRHAARRRAPPGRPAAAPRAQARALRRAELLQRRQQADCYRWPASNCDGYFDDSSSSLKYGGTNPALRPGSLLALPASVSIASLGSDDRSRRRPSPGRCRTTAPTSSTTARGRACRSASRTARPGRSSSSSRATGASRSTRTARRARSRRTSRHSRGPERRRRQHRVERRRRRDPATAARAAAPAGDARGRLTVYGCGRRLLLGGWDRPFVGLFVVRAATDSRGATRVGTDFGGRVLEVAGARAPRRRRRSRYRAPRPRPRVPLPPSRSRGQRRLPRPRPRRLPRSHPEAPQMRPSSRRREHLPRRLRPHARPASSCSGWNRLVALALGRLVRHGRLPQLLDVRPAIPNARMTAAQSEQDVETPKGRATRTVTCVAHPHGGQPARFLRGRALHRRRSSFSRARHARRPRPAAA